MDIEQIKELMDHLQASQLKRLVYKKGDLELELEKESAFPEGIKMRPVADIETAYEARLSSKGAQSFDSTPEPSGSYVESPMVGTFYASPGPDQPVFVKIGDQVTEDTIVCIIEAMKVMNEVKAGMRGIVAEVLVENAQPVEFGTRLLKIT